MFKKFFSRKLLALIGSVIVTNIATDNPELIAKIDALLGGLYIFIQGAIDYVAKLKDRPIE